MESRILGCGIYRFGSEVGILDSEKVRIVLDKEGAILSLCNI